MYRCTYCLFTSKTHSDFINHKCEEIKEIPIELLIKSFKLMKPRQSK